MFYKIALKNIFRNKRRTLITEIGIITGVIVIIFVGGFLKGMSKDWSDGLINAFLGHIQIIDSKYYENLKTRPLSRCMKDSDGIEKILRKNSHVKGVTRRLSFGGLIGTGEKSTTFFGYGADLMTYRDVLPWFDKFAKGETLRGDDKFGAFIGSGLAKNLGVQNGGSLMIISNTIDGQMNAIEIIVRGILTTGDQNTDDNLVVTTIEAVQSLLDMDGMASEIVVRLDSRDSVDIVQKDLTEQMKKYYPELTVFPWLDLSGEFATVTSMFDKIAFIVGILIFFLVAVGIANTMLMSVFERTREIGTVMAIGTEKGQIVKLFAMEGFFIGLVGAVIGVVLGSLITVIVGKIGIRLPPAPGRTEDTLICPILIYGYVVYAAGIAIVMSILASFYPARMAARLNPVDALRSV